MTASGSKGYDYSIPLHTLALPSFEFPKLLTEARIFAVGSGLDYSQTLKARLPTITILGRHEEPLRKAIQLFADWAKATDGDAVELTFVFRKSGGYNLGISPEPQRQLQRVLGFDRASVPLATGLTWVKPLTKASPFLSDFRAYKRKLVSPFLFDGAIYRGIAPEQDFAPELVTRLHGVDPILKFHATLIDEDDVRPNTVADLVKRAPVSEARKGRRRKRAPTWAAPELMDAKSAARQRAVMLRRHFPVTLHRARTDPASVALRTALVSENVRSWQFDQAICNLTLSLELGSGRLHFAEETEETLHGVILDALQGRFEHADGKPLDAVALSAPAILEQVRLDALALLSARSVTVTDTSLAGLQTTLAAQGLLDPAEGAE